jgi:hypothetical protein
VFASSSISSAIARRKYEIFGKQPKATESSVRG